MSATLVRSTVTRVGRRTVWVLARSVSDRYGTRREYFVGEKGENGGPSRSPFRADAFKFSTARSALECAQTHNGLRDSETWRLIPVVDMVPDTRR